MNILILNWRDPKNPRSGGAESVTFKYAAYWAGRGHQVIWICNSFPNCRLGETISRVRFIRIEPQLGFTVLQLFLTYPLFLIHSIWTTLGLLRRQKFDLVIDEIHGLPFFTPLYCRIRTILWVCEVAGPIWDKMYPWPINQIGKILEKLIYQIYDGVETWAISENTRRDILALNSKANVKIIPLGVDPVARPKVHKNPFPSAVFLARMVKMKGVEVALQATRDISQKLPHFKLFLVGTGPVSYVQYLRKMIDDLNISKNVEFLGKVSESDKYEILARSHFLIHPSYREGFGLTVLEAGLVGTPTIARAGSSMDELIADKVSGLIFQSDSQIAKLFIHGFTGSKYKLLSQNAGITARTHLWSQIFQKPTLL
ncbi:hypothetical protein A2634_04875 [Candidatus Amesbacteria bacterium RIFCSPHIGHO2_01_FULL_48_32]|uniref:Glycosyl transferase family 1 domain-containing protein n=1 Tax=Candidatus Amesbacteria bacterium RIFCSPLOWO2_01_FULL_48_25 TaxID=1797259 RepID=A0A1F4ZCL3_9BACT|nr:MAG: hypothetical protein A2634_04875 [Candidatus Amesbacteria bacterium RIFCSPHIGHO2_01_FULL_48_32]OGD04001.1 MAG: hypothetical protein A2989_01225 [Candidatus Amesbacteria bacterium RIFCSPLOWO2_01_FULL_48_25]HJZ05735.1 glycosyltransferase family 4 protein [Patescibacteria group bacterium]